MIATPFDPITDQEQHAGLRAAAMYGNRELPEGVFLFCSGTQNRYGEFIGDAPVTTYAVPCNESNLVLRTVVMFCDRKHVSFFTRCKSCDGSVVFHIGRTFKSDAHKASAQSGLLSLTNVDESGRAIRPDSVFG